MPDGLQRQIRVDGAGTIAQQSRKMMYFSRLSGFQDNGKRGSLFGLDQMLMYGRDSQQGRNRHMILIHAPVCQDQDVGAVPVYSVHFHKQVLDSSLKLCIFIVGDRYFHNLKTVYLHIFNLQHIRICQDRMLDLEHLAVDRLLIEQVAVFSYIDGRRGNDFLTDRIDRRVRHLGKQLFKVIKQRLMFIGKYSQRCIDTHGADAFCTIQCHVPDGCPVFLICISKGLLQPCQLLIRVLLYPDIWNLQIRKLYKIAVQPLAVRLADGIFFFQFVIIDHTSLHRIHQQHLARMQSFLLDDLPWINIQYSYLGRQDQITVICNIIPGWSQTVPVEHGTDQISVTEDDGGRSVPGLHHSCIILIEILLFLVHRIIVCPWLRYGDHHSQRQIHAAHHQELQRIIQHSGIGACGIYHRKNLVELTVEIFTGHGLLTCQHLVRISADGVDLTVMYDQPVRMRSFPARIRIGTESGVDSSDR